MAGIRKRKGEILVKLANTDELIPLALYIRVSSIGQDVENSVDAQLKHLKEWAKENGYVIVRIFIDEAKSGRSGNRPNFQEMIREAEEPDCPFEAVAVYKFSRFYRNFDESSYYKFLLKKKGIPVISINESMEDTAAGRLSEGMLELVYQFQSENTGEEVHRGTHNLAERGFFLGARAPHGMMKVQVEDGRKMRNRLAPDPETAPYIRRIFDLALEEKTEKQVTKAANKEGIPNPSGRPWKAQRIHDVLTNVHYATAIGWAMRTDEPTITWGAHEGIVTKDEYQKVEELLESRAPEVSNPRNEGSEHPFSGMMKCMNCKSPYTYAPAAMGRQEIPVRGMPEPEGKRQGGLRQPVDPSTRIRGKGLGRDHGGCGHPREHQIRHRGTPCRIGGGIRQGHQETGGERQEAAGRGGKARQDVRRLRERQHGT